MSLPSNSDLETLGYSYLGQPFVQITSKSSIDTLNLGFSYLAVPFTSGGSGTTSLIEACYFSDLASAVPSGQDYGQFGEQLRLDATIWLTEGIYFGDVQASGVQPIIEDVFYQGTVFINVLEGVSSQNTTIINIIEDIDDGYTTTINVIPNNFALVTNASSVDNPVKPTLVVGGNTIFSNPATIPPGGLANARCYVNYECNSVTNSSLSNLFNWNFTIDDEGGTFKYTAINSISGATLGASTQLMGLSGSITKTGIERNSSTWGYIYSGILGPVLLNKPIAFLSKSNPVYTQLVPGQTLVAPNVDQWKTYADASAMIAGLAGASISWLIPDLPLTDFSPQSGQNGKEALSTLASEAGGRLRWTGGNHFNVAFPNRSFGIWQVPDCCLFQSLTEECNLDLTTGIFNPGIYLFNQLPIYNPGTILLPAGTSSNPSVVTNQSDATNQFVSEQIFTTNKKMTSKDPPVYVDLPYDWVTIRIAVVTVTDGGGIYVTTDPTKDFLLQTGFAGHYINNIDTGGVLKPVVKIDWTLFPQNNSDVDAGHFYMTVNVVRANLGGQFDKAKKDGNDPTTQQNEGRTFLKYRFIPVCTLNASIIFWGSIPMPGMEIRGSLGDYTIPDGFIIETVDMNSPGILNITAINWAELEVINNYLNMGQNNGT